VSACPVCRATEAAPMPGVPCWSCLRGIARGAEGKVVLGDYELLDPKRPLGCGSSGVVYLAKQRVSGELVALKLPKANTPHELFLRQARIEGRLQHPHIVSARLGPQHEGKPSLVMPFIDGGKLREHASRRGPLAKRLELAVKIARAVHAAHELGIVHCDLKADNVLLDSRGEPHLCDFGAACGVQPAEEGIPFGGTRGWMSPEQVRLMRSTDSAREVRLTTTSDVFTLGMLLHWLVTGVLPFGSAEKDFYRRVLEEGSPPLPRYHPGLRWGMLAVARRALAKSPSARYSSAAALADDLEALRDHRTTSFQVPFAGRVWRGAKRHPGARNAIFVLLPVFALVLTLVVRHQRQNLRQAVLGMNAYAASGQAAGVLYRLRNHADVVMHAASSPDAVALVLPPRPLARDASGQVIPNQNPCRSQTTVADPAPLRPFAQGFSTFGVIDSSGCTRARISEEPPPLDFIQRRLDWRQYFDEAKKEAELGTRTVGIRMAYRSSVSGLVKIALSYALFAPAQGAGRPTFAGVLTGSLVVEDTLVLPDRRRMSERDHVTVVLGPFQGDSPTASNAGDEYTFLSHPKLKRGAKVTLDPGVARALAAAFPPSKSGQFELPLGTALTREGYEDPLLGGRWLAAFAPIGGTGYVVLVQTREAFVAEQSLVLSQVAVFLGVVWVLLLGAWGGLLWWSREPAQAPQP
jgi:eukaryotic-like serine/threonine-protein kinase